MLSLLSSVMHSICGIYANNIGRFSDSEFIASFYLPGNSSGCLKHKNRSLNTAAGLFRIPTWFPIIALLRTNIESLQLS